MQPYFMPYAGYFRLFAHADLFVVYDCVQFPRRGWVHRNRLRDAQARLQWLTLPLAHADFHARIADLAFRPQAEAGWRAEMRRFPALATPRFTGSTTQAVISDLSGTPVDYLERTLGHVCSQLGLPFNTVRSSHLGLPASLRGQARILAILKALGGTAYVNSPGGDGLYSREAFAAHGIELRFLPAWQGDFASILQQLPDGSAAAIQQDICRQGITDTAREEGEWKAS